MQLRPEDMQAHQVTLEGVMDATSNAVDTGLLKFSSGNVIGPGGNIADRATSGSASSTSSPSSPPPTSAR